MAKNDYLARLRAERKQYITIGMDFSEQRIFDMLCLVLHDPKYMGKNTFGADRLRKLHAALTEVESQWKEAWLHTQESDYYQEKLDDSLREIFGEIVPFDKRYPYQKQWDYSKKLKE